MIAAVFANLAARFGMVLTLAALSLACGAGAASDPDGRPPAVAAEKAADLPMAEPKVQGGYYPGSNESGQLRLQVTVHKPSATPIDIPEGLTPSPVTLRFTGPVQGLLIQDEGMPAVGDLDGLIRHLVRNAKTDREKAEALYRFAAHEMKDWYFPAQGVDLTVEDLKTLIWNFGFGFCYDLGRLQAGLWARAGLRSRIVGWPQHSLAEVFYDGAWRLYDGQHRSFYLKEDGSVAGFHDLKANGALFHKGLNAFGLDAIGYPPHHMAHWYGLANPKFEDSHDGEYWKVEKDFRIDLRAGEMFEILYTQPGVAYHPDSWVIYYGEMSLRKSPPWPLQGRLAYVPSWTSQKALWEPTTTPNGKPGFALSMANPYIFTEGWIKVPGVPGSPKLWIESFGSTKHVGRLVHGNGVFNRYIAGSNAFRIIIEPERGKGSTAEELNLAKAEVHTRLQLSHLGLPTLKPGRNRWPVRFTAGSPNLSLWYLESSPDLAIDGFRTEPEHPKPGQDAALVYQIKNRGSRRNKPTSLTVFNTTTGLLSETVEKVGVNTIPPIPPGETYEARFYWQANTRMTWYGQNPYVQLMDAWLDMEKDRADPDRENNRSQNYVLLRKEDGVLPQLPGYSPLHGVDKP